MNEFDHSASPPTNVGTAVVQGEEANTSAPVNQKKRTRLSAGDKKAKLEAVASDYREGYPMLAIMLRQHLTKPQLNDMLAHLFVIERLTPVTPTYEVVAVSSPIKALFQSANSPVEYVRVEQSHHGINLTPYTAGDENGHN